MDLQQFFYLFSIIFFVFLISLLIAISILIYFLYKKYQHIQRSIELKKDKIETTLEQLNRKPFTTIAPLLPSLPFFYKAFKTIKKSLS